MSSGLFHRQIELVLDYVKDSERFSLSDVCKDWYYAECKTRERNKIDVCYAAEPSLLSRRCPNLKQLKLKGVDGFPEGKRKKNWGCEVEMWVKEIAEPNRFQALKSVHFRRMIVKDHDLDVLARARLDKLEVLELYSCSGFSTDGLLYIAKHCRKIETLLLDRSDFLINDSAWLHELALHNTSLKVLNFYLTPQNKIDPQDLETLATNCLSLVSVKIGLFDILALDGFFRAATHLEEFFGSKFSVDKKRSKDMYSHISLPPNLCGVGFFYMHDSEMPLLFPFAAKIRKLDLRFACLSGGQQCHLLPKTTNLEVLEMFNDIQDVVLKILSESCKKLKRLKIEQGPDLRKNRNFTQGGLINLAKGCRELEHFEVYIMTVNNEALQVIGENLRNLCDFRIILTTDKKDDKALPLDDGVRALLSGCPNMKKLKLYLREGDLTDLGLKYISMYGKNVREMLLGNVGDSDKGLITFSEGCPKLQKLEMRGCMFSEWGIANAVMKMHSLRYLWAWLVPTGLLSWFHQEMRLLRSYLVTVLLLMSDHTCQN